MLVDTKSKIDDTVTNTIPNSFGKDTNRSFFKTAATGAHFWKTRISSPSDRINIQLAGLTSAKASISDRLT